MWPAMYIPARFIPAALLQLFTTSFKISVWSLAWHIVKKSKFSKKLEKSHPWILCDNP